MKTKVIGMSITSETVSQNILSGEMEEPIRDDKITEIAKKVPRVPNKDKEQSNDQGNNQERETETEIEQTGKDLNRAREEAYFNFIQTQKKKTARMKWIVKKRTIWEDPQDSKNNISAKRNKGKMTTTTRGKIQSKMLLTWNKSIIGDLAISEVH